MNPGVFIIGTDTDIGKTQVATALVRALVDRGVRAVGFKPVGSGARPGPEGRLLHPDALALQAVSAPRPELVDINPYAFEPAIAPHLAAERAGVQIDLARVQAAARALSGRHEFIVAEGAGGLRVPLGPGLDSVDLIRGLGWPCVLVVGLRLGCLNHARLTVEALPQHGLSWLGWVANDIDPDYAADADNLRALETHLDGPCLGQVRHASDLHHAARALDNLAAALVEGYLRP